MNTSIDPLRGWQFGPNNGGQSLDDVLAARAEHTASGGKPLPPHPYEGEFRRLEAEKKK